MEWKDGYRNNTLNVFEALRKGQKFYKKKKKRKKKGEIQKNKQHKLTNDSVPSVSTMG